MRPDSRQARFDFWGPLHEPHSWLPDDPQRPPTPGTPEEARALALSILGPPPKRQRGGLKMGQPIELDAQGRRILERDEYGPVVVAKKSLTA